MRRLVCGGLRKVVYRVSRRVVFVEDIEGGMWRVEVDIEGGMWRVEMDTEGGMWGVEVDIEGGMWGGRGGY